jgi:catechol 2,3-dioxygenase-like lactoylglutathione lyase family enzyme
MLVTRAHHVSLCVTDIGGAREFYGGLLGLPEIARPDFGFPGAWYQAGEIQLHLIVAPPGVDVGARPARISPVAGHLAFEIADYEEVRESLSPRGVETIGLGAEVGQRFVRDPDGNVIELIRPGGRLGRRG